MKLSSKSWIKLPLALKQLPGITRAAADVGAYIIHQCSESPQPVSLTEAAELLGLCERTARRAASALIAAGLIEVHAERGKPSVYQITDECKALCASAIGSGAGAGSRAGRRSAAAAAMNSTEREEMEAYMSLVNSTI